MSKTYYIFYSVCMFVIFLTQNLICQSNYEVPYQENKTIKRSEQTNLSKYNKLNNFNSNYLENRINKRSDFSFKLDSIVNWELINYIPVAVTKSEYIFSEKSLNYITTKVRKDDISEFWKPISFTSHTFNNSNLLEKLTFNDWDGTVDLWDESNAQFIHTYTYNDDNLLIKYEVQDQLSLLQSRPSNLTTYVYNELGKLISISRSRWSQMENKLIHHTEIEYRHNSNNNLEEIIEFKFENALGWEVTDSTHLMYDQNNRLIEESFFAPFSTQVELKNYSKNIYTYNFDNTLDELLQYRRYDEENNDWKDKEVTIYSYYDYRSLKKSIKYDSIPELYDREKIYESKYDHNSGIESNNVLFPTLPNGNPTSTRKHFEKFVLKEQSHFSSDLFTTQLLDYRHQYYYSDIETSSVVDEIKNDFNIFPNPTSSFIKFDIPNYPNQLTVIISDINGIEMISTTLNSDHALSVKSLIPGLYFYTINYNNRSYKGKLIISN